MFRAVKFSTSKRTTTMKGPAGRASKVRAR
jgi:hypothetical protein